MIHVLTPTCSSNVANAGKRGVDYSHRIIGLTDTPNLADLCTHVCGVSYICPLVYIPGPTGGQATTFKQDNADEMIPMS